MTPPPPRTPNREEAGPPLNDRPGQKPGDFVERDLWNLDGEETAAGDKAPSAGETTAGTEQPPSSAPPPPAPDAEPVETLQPAEGAGIDQRPEPSRAGDEEPDPQATAEETPSHDPAPDPAAQDPATTEAQAPAPVEPTPADSIARPAGDTQPDTASEFDNHPTPAPAAGTTRPARLSTVEMVSLSALLLAILAGGGWALKTFFAEIPTRQSEVPAPSFPVRGERVSIKTAGTFWRKPVRSGDNADTARMEAALIPVLDLELASGEGRGALRFFFRDDQGRLVGDSVTKAFSDGTFTGGKGSRTEVAATDGFDDEGKHAAYQTSQTEPWIVEVFEGPQATASFENFSLLFKMPVSADRH